MKREKSRMVSMLRVIGGGILAVGMLHGPGLSQAQEAGKSQLMLAQNECIRTYYDPTRGEGKAGIVREEIPCPPDERGLIDKAVDGLHDVLKDGLEDERSEGEPKKRNRSVSIGVRG